MYTKTFLTFFFFFSYFNNFVLFQFRMKLLFFCVKNNSHKFFSSFSCFFLSCSIKHYHNLEKIYTKRFLVVRKVQWPAFFTYNFVKSWFKILICVNFSSIRGVFLWGVRSVVMSQWLFFFPSRDTRESFSGVFTSTWHWKEFLWTNNSFCFSKSFWWRKLWKAFLWLWSFEKLFS